jgi:hypothetical protein
MAKPTMHIDGMHECLFMKFYDWASYGFTAVSFIPLIHGRINPICIVLLHACLSIHRCFNLENTLSKCSAKKKAASVSKAPEAKTCGMKYCEDQMTCCWRCATGRHTHTSDEPVSTTNADNPNADPQLLSAHT